MPALGVCPQFANSGTCTYGAGCQFQHIDRPEVHNPTGANFSTFFANYAGFQHNPGNSAILEFYRLCDFNHWDRDDPERERAHKAFKDALVKEFNDIYGTDEKDINSWHKICTVVNIDPLPDTLRKARDAVLSKHINLVDLVDHPTGHVIRSPAGRRKKYKKRRSNTTQFTVFFDDYPGFDYDPGNSAILEFYRLCDFYGWDRDDPDREEAHQAFKDALVQEFNDIYGTDENDIDSWHKICTVLDIDPLPDTLQEARDEVLSKHINIVDLVDNPGGHVTSFESLEDLREYTVDEGKYFPAENAKQKA
ncbi:hypothetical protein CCMSSC00406_0001827 [Pleurotus cornucopiae]|uniref:Uncharacterized protein n=1 Tax=Pleurotus cornucopiae TaxID=5321 RepID=A0ACB7J375_PLECO|nr:hypothetical protein CCMSSC00406_0001827 [Pleurotus cornucopiae]